MRRKSTRPRTRATHISIWSENGQPIPDKVVEEVEQAVTTAVLAAQFNLGVRLLTQTSRA
jgi:hypothetical protein